MEMSSSYPLSFLIKKLDGYDLQGVARVLVRLVELSSLD